MEGAGVNHTERGAVAESFAATWALTSGWVCSFPARGQQPRYDLIMDDGSRLWRVQVKRAFVRTREGTGSRLVANLYHGSSVRYKAHEVDVFAIVHVDTGTIWWLPLDVTAGRLRVVLTTPFMERYRVTEDF